MIELQIARVNDRREISNMNIKYSFQKSPFGMCLIAIREDKNEEDAICYLNFVDGNEVELLNCLKTKFCGAKFDEESEKGKKLVEDIFYKNDQKNSLNIKLLLKGTDFQVKVWESITNIPIGSLHTYEQVAKAIDNPKAVRAVGNALGANDILYLIPCHRVICKNGYNKFSSCVKRKEKMQEFERDFVNS
ncbi:hypothetical protein QAD02_022238 [Eretmocerus hayati]|uniref:Uncharacterized protein n=1 Tax=Eretmocerus hayati TaxID=131215 RepID=A0ACC2PT19_9HYME|nr:hypothetical protein QAD02_022238 [Eretmocerus hayati]